MCNNKNSTDKAASKTKHLYDFIYQSFHFVAGELFSYLVEALYTGSPKIPKTKDTKFFCAISELASKFRVSSLLQVIISSCKDTEETPKKKVVQKQQFIDKVLRYSQLVTVRRAKSHNFVYVCVRVSVCVRVCKCVHVCVCVCVCVFEFICIFIQCLISVVRNASRRLLKEYAKF